MHPKESKAGIHKGPQHSGDTGAQGEESSKNQLEAYDKTVQEDLDTQLAEKMQSLEYDSEPSPTGVVAPGFGPPPADYTTDQMLPLSPPRGFPQGRVEDPEAEAEREYITPSKHRVAGDPRSEGGPDLEAEILHQVLAESLKTQPNVLTLSQRIGTTTGGERLAD